MNWAALAAGIAALTFLLTVAGIIFIAGKLTQQLVDGKERFTDHDERLNSHESRIGAGEVAIGELKAWRDGYNSAARRLPPATAD